MENIKALELTNDFSRYFTSRINSDGILEFVDSIGFTTKVVTTYDINAFVEGFIGVYGEEEYIKLKSLLSIQEMYDGVYSTKEYYSIIEEIAGDQLADKITKGGDCIGFTNAIISMVAFAKDERPQEVASYVKMYLSHKTKQFKQIIETLQGGQN